MTEVADTCVVLLRPHRIHRGQHTQLPVRGGMCPQRCRNDERLLGPNSELVVTERQRPPDSQNPFVAADRHLRAVLGDQRNRSGVASHVDHRELTIPRNENRLNASDALGELAVSIDDLLFSIERSLQKRLQNRDQVFLGNLLRFVPHVDPLGEDPGRCRQGLDCDFDGFPFLRKRGAALLLAGGHRQRSSSPGA